MKTAVVFNYLVVVIFRKLNQSRKSDDAVHKLCSQSSQSADC